MKRYVAQTAVAAGTGRSALTSLEDDDAQSLPRRFVGVGQAKDPSSHNDYVRSMRHALPRPKQIRQRGDKGFYRGRQVSPEQPFV